MIARPLPVSEAIIIYDFLSLIITGLANWENYYARDESVMYVC